MNATDQPSHINKEPIADQILRQLYAPTSVLVNENGDILYITGHTGNYLEPVAGKPNWNIYAMARDGLHQVLPGAFHKAMQNFDAVIIRNIKLATNEVSLFIDVSVQRIANPKSSRGKIIVIFTDVTHIIKYNSKNPGTKKQSSIERVNELEVQLQISSEELQILREEIRISEEELKLSNETFHKSQEGLYNINNRNLESSETI